MNVNDLKVAIEIVGRDAGALALLGRARGELDTLAAAAARPTGALDGLLGALGKIGLAAVGVVALTGAVVGLGAGLAAPIMAASDLSESLNKADVVFGKASGTVKEFAATAAAALGQSEQQALAATGTFGNLFTSMGLGRAAAADMSIATVKLASDLASFNNVPIADALAALQSGLVGETEPMRQFGVAINETAVQAEALRLGLAKNKDELSEAAKVQARYSLIMQLTTNAQGDFARTSDGTANSLRIIQATFANATTQIGQHFLPGVQSIISALGKELPALLPIVVRAFQPLAQAFGDAAQRAAEFIRSGQLRAWAESVASTVQFVIGALGILAGGFAQALGDIARIVLSVGAIILQGLQLLNPFARHSPSLVEQVEAGFARIAAVVGDLPARVIPALSAAGEAMTALGVATAAALGAAADKADAALLKQVALLGGQAVPAYVAARDRLTELQGAIGEVDAAMRRQEATVKGLRDALKPMEQEFERIGKRVGDLKDRLDRAQRTLRDLTSTPLTGENEADQKTFGLRNAMNILELERLKLIQSGAREDDKRVKALDKQIEAHRQALEIAELERKVQFDGQRNFIEQVAGQKEAQERGLDEIIGGIVAQRQAIEQLQPQLDEATAEQQRAADAIALQKARIEEQQAIYDVLKEQHAALTGQAREWQAALGEVEKAARAAAAELEKAKGGAGAGAGVPKLPPLELPDLTALDTAAQTTGDLGTGLADLKKKMGELTGPLKDFADRVQAVADAGTSLADAWDALKRRWDEARPTLDGLVESGIKPVAAALGDWRTVITDFLIPALAGLVLWWRGDGTAVHQEMGAMWRSTLTGAIEVLQSWLKLLLTGGLAPLVEWWTKHGSKTFADLQAWWKETLPKAIEAWNGALALGRSALHALKEWWDQTGQPLFTTLQGWWDTAFKTALGIFATAVTGARDALNLLKQWWDATGSGLFQAVSGTVGALGKALSGDPDSLAALWGKAQAAATELAVYLAGLFTESINAVVNSGPIKTLRGALDGLLGVVNAIRSAFEKLADAIRNLPTPKFPGVPSEPPGYTPGPGLPGLPGVPDLPGGPGEDFPLGTTAWGGTAVTINIYPQGSVLTSDDLAREVYEGLVRLGLRQGGLTFSGSLA